MAGATTPILYESEAFIFLVSEHADPGLVIDPNDGTYFGLEVFSEDPDPGETVTYSFVNGGSGGKFGIENVGGPGDQTSGSVTVEGVLNFATASSHDLTIRATSTDLSTADATFTVYVYEERTVSGTPAKDEQIFFEGTSASFNGRLIDEDFGLDVPVSGTFKIISESYDGGGGGTGDELVLGNSANLIESQGSDGVSLIQNIEKITGGTDVDIILLSDLAGLVVSGGGGHDIIRGASGNYVLNGDAGDDIIIGDDESTLNGGIGDDRLFGSGGNNQYLYEAGDGKDVIFDTGGDDTIVFGTGIGPLTQDDLSFSGLDLIIDTDGTGNNTITVKEHFKGDGENIETLEFDGGSTLDLTNLEFDPVLVLPAPPTVPEDSSNNSIAGIVIDDPDGGTITVRLTATSTMSITDPSDGDVHFYGDFGDEDTPTDVVTMTFVGQPADVNQALATLTYTPTANDDDGGSIRIEVFEDEPFDPEDPSAPVLLFDETLVIDITPENDPPGITSNGGGSTAAVSVNENTTAVTTVVAADIDSAPAYVITGGADQAFFEINATTGVLAFKTGPDFEAPGDANGNNVYEVVVEATDGSLADTQAISITVDNLSGVTLNGTSGKNTLNGTREEDTLKGKNGKDTLKGKGGNDLLNGGKGKDKLIGGDGEDAFLFRDKITSSNIDTIKDFEVGTDRIRLDDKVFTKIGGTGDLKAKFFEKGKKADDGKDRIIYDKKSGNLYYDKDGKGGKDQVKFANLDKGLKLTEDDFLVV